MYQEEHSHITFTEEPQRSGVSASAASEELPGEASRVRVLVFPGRCRHSDADVSALASGGGARWDRGLGGVGSLIMLFISDF